MTQINTRPPLSPRDALACCAPIDELLDPKLFKALCDPTRLLLLACLLKCGRPSHVSEIAECCNVDLSVVSRHLHMLASAGVLTSTRAGRVVRYQADGQRLAGMLRKLADAVEQCGRPTGASNDSASACCADSGGTESGGCCGQR